MYKGILGEEDGSGNDFIHCLRNKKRSKKEKEKKKENRMVAKVNFDIRYSLWSFK